ncbi:MAG: cell division protein FtsZ, partial [Muribaculaceae bacterium]|nr:cell division protein FtsZ [Muribaculaceae bacterium]
MDNNEIYNLTDDADFLDDPNASIIKVIGVGGGGSNAVNYMYRQDIPNVNFVVCNTDKQHLNEMQVPTKLLLGWNTTKGRGAGNNPEVGRQCAEESAEEIKRLFIDGTEMVFITAGMGGGTGTGAAPVVAKLAKEAGMLTIGIVTVHVILEGERKIIKAL